MFLKNHNYFLTLKCIFHVEYIIILLKNRPILQYVNAIKELYTDYIMLDGLVERTFYIEPEYINKTFVQEAYKNRIDKLISIEPKSTVVRTGTIKYSIGVII